MKVALVYDRVNKFGGAERVLQALHHLFPDAPLYTLVFDPLKAPWASAFVIHSTFLNLLPFLRSKHEILSPLAPLAFETFNFDEYDLVISVTSSDAKAIITKPHTLHICYCLTPTRYFWSGKYTYSRDIKMKLLPEAIKKYLRTVDLLTSTRPDRYIAISNEVKDRIKTFYSRNSGVVYPPIDDKFYSVKTTPADKRRYYLVVSRLVPYKRVDLVIKVFNKSNKPLKIVGVGSEMNRLRKMASRNIEFLGSVTDKSLIKQYQNAIAVIFPQKEDFGLVPIEAQSCGTPVIAYGKGGALETIVDKKTGLFFTKQTVKSLANSIDRFEKLCLQYQDCLDQAKKFSSSKFSTNFLSEVKSIYREYRLDPRHRRH